MDSSDFVELGGIIVTREWAELFTATEADAKKELKHCREELRRNYFPKANRVAIQFIKAKYPTLRNVG